MGTTKELDIKQFQIWKAHGRFEQPDKTVLEEMTLLIMSSLDWAIGGSIVAMGLFKEKNDFFKFWEHLDIDIEECYLAGDCLYSIVADSIRGNIPLCEITDDSIMKKIIELYNRNFD